MNQPAKAPEPSMEEILASIRRIIADDDAVKPAPKPAPKPEPAPVKAAPPPPAPPAASTPMGQDDIDALLAGFDDAAAAEETPEPEPEPQEDVLELTEAMAAPEPEAKPSFRKIDAQQDVVFQEPVAPPPPPRQSFAPPPRMSDGIEPALLSATTTAAVNSAFGSLAHTVLVHNAKTLEDLVKEMLRPMLKAWLDDNLPSLVERLVRAEIERVSRGQQQG
jgi:cell pole-organizing protein PopZ